MENYNEEIIYERIDTLDKLIQYSMRMKLPESFLFMLREYLRLMEIDYD